MNHKLNDITLYYKDELSNERKIFTGISNKVSQLYVHFLDGYKPKGTTRVSVQLTEEEEENFSSFYFGSILSFNYSFDYEKFWLSDLEHKLRIILDTVHKIAIACCQKYNWDMNVFVYAYQKVLDVNFENKISYAKKLSRNKQTYGEILVETNIEKAIVFVRFLDLSSKVIKEVEIFSCPQHVMFYYFITKRAKWISVAEFGYADALFEWKVSINSNVPSLVLLSKTKDEAPAWLVYSLLEHLEYDNKSSIEEILKANFQNWK